jgi:subtilisin family serine protease
MKSRRRLAASVLALALCASSASAERRYIVRDLLGLSGLLNSCLLLGCSVERGLGDPTGQLFLIVTDRETNPLTFVSLLLSQLGVVHAEVDQLAGVTAAPAYQAPAALDDRRPVSYHGAVVWNGYVQQPVSVIVRRAKAHGELGVTGKGIVAIIDTGLDPNHPAYRSVLVSGYDFTRNVASGSEMGDVDQRTVAVLDGAEPAYVNQRTVAVLDQRTAAVLDQPGTEAFGHGTMVAGVVHLIAPKAQIMPLKAFRANGTGYTSDIVRAVYYAVSRNAKVINMSFSLAKPSTELRKATEHATKKKVVCVSSAGNDGARILVYPAALSNVTGVASTTNYDARSDFSNYGASLVWLAAPGEGIVTTYPWGSYAAGWGTSFSTPLVAGTGALMNQVSSSLDQSKADAAFANAVYVAQDLNHGRLDVYSAVKAWRTSLGLR